nr:hydroxymethylpyrimidine/phosphomethylpyrimidine kinase [Pedobacter panaciterrae]
MLADRPYAISIAGFDPSAGAGVLADIKCFEQHHVYGFGVCSALTIQTDSEFLKNDWLDSLQIIAQLEPLIARHKVSTCKIGLIKDVSVLYEVVCFLKSKIPDLRIIVDPVLKASSGYEFHDWANGMEILSPVLKQIDLITPNYNEMLSLGGHGADANHIAKLWAAYCPVLLKGGHNIAAQGTDYLYEQSNIAEFSPQVTQIHQKHGSGCVLSAAIAANIALGISLKQACSNAKLYIEKFLNSNNSLLGYHSL